MSREAMQIALEALEKVITAFGSGLTLQQKAATALRQALETKREWQGLTDEEIQDLSYLSQKIDEGNAEWFDRLGFARAIEDKLKGKNHG
jgi:hypothetical protein